MPVPPEEDFLTYHTTRDLKGLDPKGRPCENCSSPMADHLWVHLDYWGFVHNCNIQPIPSTLEVRMLL